MTMPTAKLLSQKRKQTKTKTMKLNNYYFSTILMLIVGIMTPGVFSAEVSPFIYVYAQQDSTSTIVIYTTNLVHFLFR